MIKLVIISLTKHVSTRVLILNIMHEYEQDHHYALTLHPRL